MRVDLGRFGLWVPSYALLLGPLEETVREIEQLGYGSLFLGAISQNLDVPEAVLAATERIPVVTGILSIWTMPAAEAAAAFARIDAAMPDRLVLGLGVSHEVLVDSTGDHYERPYQRMVEYLDALDAAGDAVPADRRLLAALGPKMLRLSATRAAGSHPYLVTPEHTAQARAEMGPGALLAPEQKVVLSTERVQAREIARKSLAIYLTLPNYLRNLERLGFTDADFADRGSDRLVDALVAWGDEYTIATRLREHLDAGADHVAIQVLDADTDPMNARLSLPGRAWADLAGELGL